MMRVLGLAVFLLSIPLFFALVKGSLRSRRAAWFLLGLMPFTIGAWHLDVSIISWGMWPGYVKGMIVSLLDALALAIACTVRDPVRTTRPLLWPYLAFLAGSAVSIAFATPAMASFFFTWQLARAILLFVAVSKVTSRPEGTRYVVAGLAAGIAFQAAFSIRERLGGVTQASGTLGHQNLLGLCTHFALMFSIAAILAGDRRWIVKFGALGGIIAVVLTGSRATTGLAAIGVVVLVLLSLLRRTSALKIRVALAGSMALLIAAPLAFVTLHTRYGSASIEGSDEERVAFERAARAMWSDHPMGVGANQYVVVANAKGYSARAGVIWNWTSRSANVHNTYLLLGAETGFLGVGTFLLLLVAAIVRGTRVAWARPRSPNGEYALAAVVALIVVAVHCLYEWVFVTWVAQYLFAIALGLISGTAVWQRSLSSSTSSKQRTMDESRNRQTRGTVPL